MTEQAAPKPILKITRVESLAGTFPPHVEKKPNHVAVIVTHSKSQLHEDGCGALGHLNPRHAEHGVDVLFAGLGKHGIIPEQYFGMPQEELVRAVKSVGFEESATARAKNLAKAFDSSTPLVYASVGHEDGSMKVFSQNLDKLDPKGVIFVSGSVCSDARVDPEFVEKALQCAMQGGMACGAHKELVAKDAQTQQPSQILVYGADSVMPYNQKGGVFKVSFNEDGDLLKQLLSIAYAIASFGPFGHSGPKSLSQIKLVGVPARAETELRKRLFGLKGIEITG